MKTLINSLLLTLFFAPAFVLAQNTVSGMVTEAGTNIPIAGVNIIVKGTTTGTVTDFDGNFSLQVNKGNILEFSFIGFVSQEITYNGQAILNIEMKEDTAMLDEVVVIGYGTAKKEDVTGAADLVTTKDFNQGPIVNAPQLIQGKVAGVSVTSSSGAPGDGQEIRIRGNSSLSLNNNPLIVLDGIPLDQGGIGGSRNPLNLVNPNDIESMTVLKDASATSIYGSRAANGVIIVTTKKGKSSDFKFNFNTLTSVGTPIAKLDVLNAEEFRQVVPTLPRADATTLSLLKNYDTDWQDEIYGNAYGQDHSFSALGAAWGVPMRASVSYTDYGGILKRDSFKRTTGSISLTPKLFDDHLKIELNARGNYTENFFANRDAIGSASSYAPTEPVYDTNSPFAGYSSWTEANGLKPSLAGTNPVALLNLKDDESEVRRLIMNAKLDYKLHFFEDLTATVNVGLDKSNSHGRTNTSEFMPTTDPTWDGANTKFENETTNQLFDAYLTYNNTFNEVHDITAVAGYSYQSFEYDNYSYDSIDEANKVTYEFIDKSKNVLLSYFGRLNYDYDGRYLVTATLRADASSKLNPDDRWGYFPSIALAWNIHNESFLEDLNFNELKLRVGYGEVGNVNGLPDYLFLTRYTGSQSSANYQFGNIFYQTYRPDPINPDLRWEVGNTLNVGIDYSFLDRRISGSLNGYIKQTKDLIASATIDPFTNFGSRIEKNIGDMENKGVEFAVNVVPIRTEDFEWSINYNIAVNDNKITNLPFDQQTGNISGGTGNQVQIHTEGEAPYSFFVFEQVYDANGKPIEGAYVDRNGDNVINDEDKYIYKNPYADVIMGLNTNLNYKKWDLSVITRANLGNYAYNNIASASSYSNNIIPTTNNYLTNVHSSYLDNGFVFPTDENFRSDHFVQDASFFKIDNITLGYTIDDAIKNSSFRLYGSVQNLLIVTDYDGLDPEINGGIDNNFYPRPRTFVLGLNVSF
ncbi:SusC/RagA family TonB-linked outer membrane protein [Pseudotamlana carrageenivorans]|uniref:SusC/RagA family TonB-linked outer membrane protein n=1 Tax=Pseudotamlana carrageenivorans TaxID=2069432 RepID=A0A2I7SEH9_9FLAO|nr:TonB-dependent receptor [Tamlana carrageenivorans]AUS04294.1 SusC/RagA family TonB-linked outer membrane protein [Tamlana carrageenivorans]